MYGDIYGMAQNWIDAPKDAKVELTIPKEPKKYRTTWWLTDLSDISKTILDATKRYREELLLHQRRRSANPKDLVSFVCLEYLTASRPGELLRKPLNARRLVVDDWTVIKVEKLNEKHFTSTGEPAMMTQNLPVRTQADRELWDYVFEGGAYGWERKFDFSMLGTYEKRTRITEAIKSNFKADLTDGEHIYRSAGIVPYILRHLRVYNLRFNQGYDDSLVQSFLGWTKREMIEHYVYIQKQLKDEEQLRQLKKYLDNDKGDKPQLTDVFGDSE